MILLRSRSAQPSNSLTIISYVTQGLCITLVSTCVALRFYSNRSVRRRSFSREDFACIIATLLGLGYCIAATIYTSFGGGYHIWELVNPSHLRRIRQVQYAAFLIYIPAVFFIKVLLLIVLVQLFALRESMSRFIRVLIVFLFLYYFTVLFVWIFVCTPISTVWDPDNGGTCIDYAAVLKVDAFVSLTTDGAILILPVILVWPLHVPITRKIKIAVILGFGGLAMISNIYRLYLDFSQATSTDTTGFHVKLFYTGAAEIGLGLFCACLPAINALISVIET